MSERQGEKTRLNADERYELAQSTEAAARRNRPSHLVVVAGLVFVAACAAVGFATFAANGASADLTRRTAERDEIAALISDLVVIEQTRDEAAVQAMAPVPGLLTQMERVAQRVGLPHELALPTERRSPDAPGAERVTYTYSIHGPDLATLLAFVREGRNEIPGMRVAGLNIKPRNDEWAMEVRFERWERTG